MKGTVPCGGPSVHRQHVPMCMLCHTALPVACLGSGSVAPLEDARRRASACPTYAPRMTRASRTPMCSCARQRALPARPAPPRRERTIYVLAPPPPAARSRDTVVLAEAAGGWASACFIVILRNTFEVHMKERGSYTHTYVHMQYNTLWRSERGSIFYTFMQHFTAFIVQQ